MRVETAVVLAAGGGRRMRAFEPDSELTSSQRAAADLGLKGLMPIAGRPFLDYLVGALAEVGVGSIGFVTAPESPIAAYAAGLAADLDVVCVTQLEPLGTAHALLQAQPVTAARPFLVVNSDTFYPPVALAAMAGLDGDGLLAVERGPLLASGGSNLTERRLAEFAVVERDDEGYLRSIREKPGWDIYRGLGDPLLLSVNCWRFGPEIYGRCKRVVPSPRGELELPAAATLAVAEGDRVRVVGTAAPVLDLSTRADVSRVAELLVGDGR